MSASDTKKAKSAKSLPERSAPICFEGVDLKKQLQFRITLLQSVLDQRIDEAKTQVGKESECRAHTEAARIQLTKYGQDTF